MTLTWRIANRVRLGLCNGPVRNRHEMGGSFREVEIVGSFRRLLTISSAIDSLVVILLDRGLINDILIRDITIQTSIETLPNFT